MIQRRIKSLMECMERDSEGGILDNQNDIKRYIERFDQNSEFLKYFKNELKNVVIQLKLEEYFQAILDLSNEPEIPQPEPPVPQPDPPQPNSEQENKIIVEIEVNPHELQPEPELDILRIFDFSDVEPEKYQQMFQQDLMNFDLNDLFYKHQKLLQNSEYFFQLLRIRILIREKYPGCQESILNILVEVMRKVSDHIEQQAPELQREGLLNQLNPMFAQIYEDENKQEFSSLIDQPSHQIYEFMVGLVQTACPYITIQKPLSLQDQQIEQFQQLKELLPSLGKKISIQEYGTLDQNSNIQDQIKSLIEDYRNNSKLNGEILLKILFDLIKRRVDFKQLLQELSRINNQNNLTQLILFQYILENSDPQLKVLLCITCAYFIPLPLLAFNPWQENEGMNKLQMTPELLYIYEKSKSLIQFKLSTNNKTFQQSTSLNGVTSLLNNLFGRQFSLHEQNLINLGTVEMQMDLNCADVEHLVIADAHGLIDIQTLIQIFPLFDGFIIHVSENNFQDQEIQSNLDLLFKGIPCEQNSEKTILIIKHDSENLYFEPRQWKNFSDKRLKVFEICTQNLQNLTDSNYQNLIKSIHIALDNFFKIDTESYKKTPERRLESKQVFLNVLKQVNDEQTIIKHQEAHYRLCKIIDLIVNQNNLKGTDFLPMLNYIGRHSKLQDMITSENHSQKEKNDARFELKQIQKAMKDEKSTEISDLFSEIVFNHQCMNLLPSLSSIVKGFLDSQLKVIIEERDKKRNQYLNTDLDQKEARQKLEQRIKDLNQAIDEKWFSTELLSRELFYLGQNSNKSSITKEDYYQLVRHFEQTAQPFELVDGDTLNFTTNVYQEVFQDYDHEDLLVVCVLGPQSSGKSLLMNYLFGTSFLSSSGRCTKGVYSSILRFKDKDGVYKRILILDTEGIQSSEARDTTFDKRIVYYAICVSHVVLMCNKGEMNAPMSETIKLVADAIANTSMPFLKNPTIYIILNMLANPNDKTQLECINELNKTLRELAAAAARQPNAEEEANSRQMVQQVLKINQDSLIPLGFAFNTFQFGSNIKRTVNKPSPEFAFRTMQLREKILMKFDEIRASNSTKYSLRDWFNHAQNFWTFSRDCKSLKEYSSLGQKRIDDELMFEIEKLIKYNFGEDTWNNVLLIYFDQELDIIFKQYQGGASVKFSTLNQIIQRKIDEKYSQIQDKVINEYKNFCQDKVIPTELSKKRQEILIRKKEQYKKDAERYTRKKLSKFIEEKSKIVGDTILLEQCIKYLKNLEEKKQDKYTAQEAKKLFNSSWKKSIDEIKKIIMKGDELTNRSIKTVTDEFKNLLNYTPGFDDENLKIAKTGKKQVLYDKIKQDFYKDGLMFIGDQFQPNIRLIIECQERKDKMYTIQEKVQLFENKTKYEYFKWWEYFQDIVKADDLATKIAAKILRSDQGFFSSAVESLTFKGKSEIQKKIEKELKILINDFNQECKKLGFAFLRDQHNFLSLYDEKKVNCSFEFLKSECKKFILQNENYSFNQIFDPFKNIKTYRGGYSNRYDIAKDLDLEYFQIYDFKKRTFTNINEFYEEVSSRKPSTEFFPIKQNTSIIISQNIKQELQKEKQIQNSYAGYSYNPFYYYLDYLKNPQYQRAVQSMNQAGQEYFFKAIQWEKVFQDVEQVILKNYKISGEIQENDQIQYYVNILAKNDENSEVLASDFNKMGPKLAKGIFRDINEIIKKIDLEIEAFCMKVSEKGKIFIFLVTQILTFLLTEQLEIISESSPLRQFKARKKFEKKLFVARLTLDDAEMDKSLGIKLAEELCTKIYQQCKQRTVTKFQSLMLEKSDDFKKVHFIIDLEGYCENFYDKQEANSQYVPSIQELISKKELIDYYFDPKLFLEAKFKSKFKEVTEDFLDNCKQEFFRTYQVKIKNLFDYFDRTLTKIEQTKINKSSTILFYAEQSQNNNLRDQIDAGQLKIETLQKKAARKYLNLLLSNQWSHNSEINVDGYQFVCSAEYILPLSMEIQNPENQQFDDEIYEIIADNLDKDNEISQIHAFVAAVIRFIDENDTLEKYLKFQPTEPQEEEKNIEGVENQINSSDDDEVLNTSRINEIQEQEEVDQIESDQIYSKTRPQMDLKKIKQNREDVIKDEELIGEHLQDFRNKFLGCYEVCPLCRKQCDQPHDENMDDLNLVHDCQQGHQFQGFGGNKTFDDEVAITYSCNNIRDQDVVFYKGQDKQWLELKNGILKNWNYIKDQNKVDLARKTQVKLWNLLGPEVCKRYQREQGLRIEFQKAEEKLKMSKGVGKVHYILMLDDSGSMSGQPWRDLINSVQTFLSLLSGNQEQKTNGKVTCINHNGYAVLYFQEQIPDRSLANQIIFRSGGNDFDQPLNMAFDICSSTHQKYDKIIYYFMSDGGCWFPTQTVNRHKTDTTFQKKIEFYSVGFGSGADMNILKQIADQMPNGQVVKALTAKELTESFKKIVINLYGEQ